MAIQKHREEAGERARLPALRGALPDVLPGQVRPRLQL